MALTGRLVAVLEWEGALDIDLSAALLDARGQVARDGDFVFYNQPASEDGCLRSMGRAVTERGHEERVVVDLDEVRAEVVGVGFAAAADGAPGTDCVLRWILLDSEGTRLLEQETQVLGGGAVLLGSLERGGTGWSPAGDPRPLTGGMAQVARTYGVTVEDAPAAATGDEEPAPAPPDHEVHTGAVAATGAEVAPVAPSPAVTTRGRPGARVGRPRPGGSAKAVPAPPKLAGGDNWVPARLFSVSGVGSAGEQEKRATSALMATAAGVKAFGRGLTALAGAPAGALETFIEVPFDLGTAKVIPDAVVRVARGARVWTALVEVKTGTGQLRAEQVESYLDVARAQGFDAVVTLSNEISPGAGEHPVAVDKRKLRKVSLVHVSWAEVLHEAQMTLHHRGVADPVQAWVLQELIRYLQHPRSGASGFQDMGAEWVPVRDAVQAGTLRSSDPKAMAVADGWSRLLRHLCLDLTAELGVPVTGTQARKVAGDARARVLAATQGLVDEGVLSAAIKVPGAAGQLQVVADLRTSRIRTSVQVGAPRGGGSQRRVSWLLRQLTEAPDDVLLEVGFPGRAESTKALLREARETTACLIGEVKSEILSFRLTRTTPMGTKRSGVKGAFIPSVTTAVEDFYAQVLQPVRAWVPPAPKLPEEAPPLPVEVPVAVG